MDISKTSSRIKELCQKNSLAIKNLLSECNINRNFIYDLERSKQIPSADKFERIANRLNCSIDYLLGRTDYPYTIQADENGKPVVMPDDEPPICTDD